MFDILSKKVKTLPFSKQYINITLIISVHVQVAWTDCKLLFMWLLHDIKDSLSSVH